MNEIIYKYLHPDRIEYFNNELIRYTQPGDLNDPFECLPAKPTVDEIISIINVIHKRNLEDINKSKFSKNQKIQLKNELIIAIKTKITKIRKGIEGNILDEFYDKAIKKINSAIGVFSLSRRWDSTLMWSHYADSHKGFCIGFKRDDPFFLSQNSISNPNVIFKPVLYDDKRIKVPIKEGEEINFDVMLTKSKDWQYEEEERLLAPFKLAYSKVPKIPYDIYLFKVPHNLIQEIIIGANTSNDKIELIKTFCTAHNIQLYKTKISPFKFDMIRNRI